MPNFAKVLAATAVLFSSDAPNTAYGHKLLLKMQLPAQQQQGHKPKHSQVSDPGLETCSTNLDRLYAKANT